MSVNSFQDKKLLNFLCGFFIISIQLPSNKDSAGSIVSLKMPSSLLIFEYMRRAILFCLFSLILLEGFSQQGFVVSGGDATGSGGSAAFSIGQVDYISFNNTNNAGVQQGYGQPVLPVTWLSFTGEKEEKTVLLKWSTGTEINTSHFIVERSVDGRTFSSIGTVAAAGNSIRVSDYTLRDISPFNGLNYYRLKQVDKDGKFIYSATVTVNFNSGIVISCYPNPVRSIMYIRFNSVDLAAYSYQLFDMGGRLVKTALISSPLTPVNVHDLNPGNYTLRVFNAANSSSFKIVKQ